MSRSGRRPSFRTVAVLTAIAAGAPVATAAAAQPGTPPQGSPGSLVAGFGASQPPRSPGIALGPQDSRFRAVTTQADGKIVAVGQEGADRASRLIVVRYTPSGALDAGFGQGGIVRGPATFSGDEASANGSYATGVAIQPDGRILVGGGLRTSDSPSGMLVLRLVPSGALDPSFSSDGVASTLTGSARAGDGEGLAVDPAGRILLAGSGTAGGGVEPVASVARFRPDGTLDPAFAGGVQQLVGIGRSSRLSAVAAQPDGRVVVAGQVIDSFGGIAALAYRLTTGGGGDSSFSGGLFIRSYARNAAFSSFTVAAIAPTGKIVLAGTAGALSSSDSVVTRLTPDGQPDHAFGNGGVVQTPSADPQGQARADPLPGAAGLAVTPATVYVGGSVEAVGAFRLLALTALSDANGAPLRSFGAPVGSEYQSGLSFTAPFGTTYSFINGASDSPYSGPQGQTFAVTRTADGASIAAAGVIASSIGGSSEPAGSRGFVALYRAAPEPPPAPTPTTPTSTTPPPEPPPAPTPTTPTTTTPPPNQTPAPRPNPTPAPPTTGSTPTTPAPSTTSTTPTPPPTGIPTAPKPRPASVSALRLTPATIRNGRAQLRFSLSAASKLSIRVELQRAGRRLSSMSSRCAAATHRALRYKRCTYVVRVPGLLLLAGSEGANVISVDRQITGRALRAGTYRLVLRAAGNNVERRITFRVR